MEDWHLELFLDEWKEGWSNHDPAIQQLNRHSMRQQMLALFAGVRRPPPAKPECGEKG